jgi:hypothetical protein
MGRICNRKLHSSSRIEPALSLGQEKIVETNEKMNERLVGGKDEEEQWWQCS